MNPLDEEGGIAKTLINHCAKHHRSYRHKIKPVCVSQAEDQAARKRNLDDDTDIIQKLVMLISLDGKNKLL